MLQLRKLCILYSKYVLHDKDTFKFLDCPSEIINIIFNFGKIREKFVLSPITSDDNNYLSDDNIYIRENNLHNQIIFQTSNCAEKIWAISTCKLINHYTIHWIFYFRDIEDFNLFFYTSPDKNGRTYQLASIENGTVCVTNEYGFETAYDVPELYILSMSTIHVKYCNRQQTVTIRIDNKPQINLSILQPNIYTKMHSIRILCEVNNNIYWELGAFYID